jgi:hypothetical protein
MGKPDGAARVHPASAAFLSAITAMRIAIHGREEHAPNLVGKMLRKPTACCDRADWYFVWLIAFTANFPSTSWCVKARHQACS